MDPKRPDEPESTLIGGRGLTHWVGATVVILLGLACYWPALRGGFLWDDLAHVISPELRSVSGLAHIWFEPGATQQYYPVVYTAFWIQHRLWGDAVLGYHLVNLGEHLIAAGLLAGLLRRLWRGGAPRGIEWLAAAIFAVHPVAVESVAWISEQKNTLSLVFYLAAAHAYLTFDATRRGRWYAIATVLFALAVGAKTVTGSLPAALLVLAWWQRGRLSWPRDVRPLLPWFALALIMGLTTATVERRLIGEGFGEVLTGGQRLLLAGKVVWFYLGKLVWPVNLVFVYPRWNVAAAGIAWGGWLVATFALTAGLWLLRRWSRAPLAAWLLFVGSLFPALGFIDVYPFRYSYVADHFQYLPMLSICALVACGFGWSTATMGRRFLLWPMGAIVIATLAWGARMQSHQYRDSETLYRTTLARNPGCWLALNNLGLELANSPARLSEAIELCRRAVKLQPALPEAHLNLGLALTRSGRPDEAIAAYEEALRLRPDYPEASEDLGLALTMLGRYPEAIDRYKVALRSHPDLYDVRCALANLLRYRGQNAEAAMHLRIALRFDATHPEVWVDYGAALADLGDRGRAEAAFTRALQLNPGFAPARLGRATIWAARPDGVAAAEAELREMLRVEPKNPIGHLALADLLAMQPARINEALEAYEHVLALAPDMAAAHHHFAQTLERLGGREKEAEEQYAEAVRLEPRNAGFYNDLAILLAQRGEFARAQACWEAALREKPDFVEARKNLELLAARRTR